MIDVYNALTIHGLVVAEEVPSSVLQVTRFWQDTAYNIGGLVFSLDDMEHGILRGEGGGGGVQGAWHPQG